MKGLLLKDLYMAKKYCRVNFVFVILCLAMSAFGVNSIFFMVYSMVFISVIPVSLISYDEKSRWNIYSEVFPWSRFQVVSAKYLMAIILVGGVWILTALAQIIRMLRNPFLQWTNILMELSVLLVMGIFSSSIILPVIFKFGAEKGRIAYYAVIVVVCAASAAVSTAGVDLNIDLPLIWIKLIPAAILIAGICVFAGSWLLSMKFYEKREL